MGEYDISIDLAMSHFWLTDMRNVVRPVEREAMGPALIPEETGFWEAKQEKNVIK